MNSFVQFPSQKKSDSQKNEKWRKECIDAAENILTFDNTLIRQSFYNKRVNYNLRNGILNERDVEDATNPYGLKISKFPAKMRHIGIGNSKLNLLTGEEIRRSSRFDFRAYISSSDQAGISSKSEAIKENWYSFLVQQIQNENQDQKVIEAEIAKYQKYMKYSFKDLKEIAANKIIRYEYDSKEIGRTFNDVFEDLLTVGEEIVRIEELGNEVSVTRVNPMNIFTIQSPETKYFEDADVIVEYGYYSPGQVVDMFYDYLRPDEIESLDGSAQMDAKAFGGMRQAYNKDISIEERFGPAGQGMLFSPTQMQQFYFGGSFDSRGNVRVIRVCWKSRRKVGILNYFNEYGEPEKTLVAEQYVPDKAKGEYVDWKWISEWWEGTKIGNTIYTKMRPIPYQGRSLLNISKCSPPYVGTMMNIGSNKVMSLMDIMKPLDYQFDIIYYRRDLAMATNPGPMLAYNIGLIPKGWKPDAWMHYSTTTRFMPLDPSNEVNKGPATGKTQGNAFNTVTASAINLEMSGYINQMSESLRQIKEDLDTISGVNNARQGNVQGEGTLGQSEIAFTASNSMTEKIFYIHNNFKKRALRKVLEVAKYVWKKNPIRVQNVMDDMLTEVVMNYDDVCESEYDVFVGNSSKDEELFMSLKDLAHAAMQNGQATFKDIIQIHKTDSIAQVTKYLEEAQEEAMQRADQAQQAEYQHEQELEKLAMQDKQADRELEIEKLNREDINQELDRQNKIYIETISAAGFAKDTDVNDNNIPDVAELAKLALDHQKLSLESTHKEREMIEKNKVETGKLDIERQKLAIEKRRLALEEQASKAKEKVDKLTIELENRRLKSDESLEKTKIKQDELLTKLEISAKKSIAKNKPKPSK